MPDQPTDPQQDEKEPFIAFCEPCITTRWCAWKGGCLAERMPPASTDLQQLRDRHEALEQQLALKDQQADDLDCELTRVQLSHEALVSALQQFGQHKADCECVRSRQFHGVTLGEGGRCTCGFRAALAKAGA
jgi:hypothetical protein